MKNTKPASKSKNTGTAEQPDSSIVQKAELNDCLVSIGESQDKNAFTTIYSHFGGRIKSFLMGKGMDAEVAEELMQEIMLIVWRRASSYNPEKSAASTWIFTIARNKRIDYLRGNNRIEVELDDALLERGTEYDAPADSLETLASHAQEAKKLSQALSQLPNEQQQVMHLSYFRGQSHGDIARWLDLPVGTVKSRIRLAMQSIRASMQLDDAVTADAHEN